MTVAEPPFNELQKQMYVALNGVISAPVYDHVPENQSKPWVTIGEVFGIPDNWHGGFGWDVSATIHVWTKSRGYKPAVDIANEIIAILDHQRDSLAIPSPWYVVAIRFQQLQTMQDPDPEIRHVPVQFQIVIHQEV
jgi:hypothetical protein